MYNLIRLFSMQMMQGFNEIKNGNYYQKNVLHPCKKIELYNGK